MNKITKLIGIIALLALIQIVIAKTTLSSTIETTLDYEDEYSVLEKDIQQAEMLLSKPNYETEAAPLIKSATTQKIEEEEDLEGIEDEEEDEEDEEELLDDDDDEEDEEEDEVILKKKNNNSKGGFNPSKKENNMLTEEAPAIQTTHSVMANSEMFEDITESEMGRKNKEEYAREKYNQMSFIQKLKSQVGM
eukprot:CAMPEP_0117425984 /NCGR_PEP_ID=MMETSP0758-20121206/6177_1 /TAXON_ID=63605 /ORGANISM="Percolomonas cosmopolitus, Strain AE-1 (ATCC 50343)" /LENGTH=191 /DNA_ID=CAMNT_0005210857 /DNA_START=35 /DNA_END=610 /DNA_ORIENTATION=+